MNTKVLIDTLTEIPDQELLLQLTQQIKQQNSIKIPDIRKYFMMLRCLLCCGNRNIVLKAIYLYELTLRTLLKTEIQLSWNEISEAVLRLVGGEDADLRKRGVALIMEIVRSMNNMTIVLEKLYEEGLHHESLLVITKTFQLLSKILDNYPSFLHNKMNVNIMKLVLEKAIIFVNSAKHTQVKNAAEEFLHFVFYAKLEKLDEVLITMNHVHAAELEKIWAKLKEKIMEKEEEGEYLSIKYEHLPLIHDKFMGVYEPFVLKNMFSPETPSAKALAYSQFYEGYFQHENNLAKYTNIIYKIILLFLPEQNQQLLLVLKSIVNKPGIANIVNLSLLPQTLISQLETENVRYRRELRSILEKMNYLTPRPCLQQYRLHLEATISWIKSIQIVQLLEHWINHNVELSYPPALNFFLLYLCQNLQNNKIPKLQKKVEEILLIILDRYSGYREILQENFSEEKVGKIEDMIEDKKRKGKQTYQNKETQEIFLKQYNEQRSRYIKFSKAPPTD